MDLFNLQATLGLNASSFIAGIGNAQQLFSSFAGAVVGFAGDVLKTGMGFDESMASVRAVLGEQEGTVENMNALREFALDQARKSIFTIEDTADAYYYMGMAGWKSEQMMKGLPGIMQLAAASGEDLGNVSDIVTDSITAFGLSADDVQGYVDILAQTATNANTNVGLMGETFKYVAPIAGSLGADVDDVAVSIGLMANAGIKGSMAGTSLRSIMTRISTNAGATSKTLGALDIITEKLGVSFWDSSGKMRDWSEFIDDVREKWAKLSDQEQVAYAKTIASQYGISGWLALMNAKVDDVEKLTKAINEAEGAAERMSEIRLDSLAGDVDLFNSSLNVLKYAIYEDVNSPMRGVVQFATQALDDITDAIGANGLQGGLDMLSVYIDMLAENESVTKLLESIGGIVGQILDVAFEKLIPKAEEAAPKLMSALLSGFSNNTAGSGNPISALLGVASGVASSGLTGVPRFLNWFFDTDDAEVQTARRNIANSLNDTVTPEVKEYAAGEFSNTFSSDFDTDRLMDKMFESSTSAADKSADYLSSAIGGAGTDGGATAGVNMEGMLAQSSDTAAGYLSNAIGGAGADAGTAFGNNFQASLNNRTYSINVNANVSGMPVQQNASAMSAGRIFSNATLFGYANGAFQVAGDAGPEAVVGVGSLQQMIAGAVMAAMSAMQPPDVRDSRPVNVIFELEGAQRWIYRLNKAEEQRVGLKLSTGGND